MRLQALRTLATCACGLGDLIVVQGMSAPPVQRPEARQKYMRRSRGPQVAALARRKADGRAVVRGAGATIRCATDIVDAFGRSFIAHQQYRLVSEAMDHPSPPFPPTHLAASVCVCPGLSLPG